MKAMTWKELGAWLERAKRDAEVELRGRVASEIELRLQCFPGYAGQLAAVLTGPFDASMAALVGVPGAHAYQARADVARFYETIEHDRDPDEPIDEEEKWSGFRELLTERLSEIREAGIEHAHAAAGLPERLAALTDEASDIWPLEHHGSLREILGAWRTGAAARMGVAEVTLLAPDQVPDRPALGPDALSFATEEVARWIPERAGWARVLFDLAPILAAADARRRN